MAKGKISAKQLEILEYIKKQILEKGYPPAVREICQAVNLKSTASVHAHLSALEEMGYIRRDSNKTRAIEITDSSFSEGRRNQEAYSGSGFVLNDPDTPAREISSVPIVGNVAAGEPLLAEQNIRDYFPIPVDMLPNAQVFMLKVKGESMINAGILDGDMVVVKQSSVASNGDMVVAMIEDGATVKYFYKENGHYRLQPDNPDFDPIITNEVTVLGHVIGVIRMF